MEKNMEKKNSSMTCIICPMSCTVEAVLDEKGNIFKVFNNRCKRGEAYIRSELTNPVRTLTSTVFIKGARYPRLPVITKGQIPKDKMFAVMEEIHKTKVCAPVKENDIIIKNVCNLGIDVVASKSVNAV